jgi:hypothetical protein
MATPLPIGWLNHQVGGIVQNWLPAPGKVWMSGRQYVLICSGARSDILEGQANCDSSFFQTLDNQNSNADGMTEIETETMKDSNLQEQFNLQELKPT